MTETTDQTQRQEKRDSLFLSATVRVGDFPAFVTRVRNLSAGGMMIDSNLDPATGTPVIAELRGIGEVLGRIAWTAAGRSGVAFVTDIDPRLARSPGASVKALQPLYTEHKVGRRPGLSIR